MQLKSNPTFNNQIIYFKVDDLKNTLNPYEKNYHRSTSGGITA
jgi:hypothetical protein